MKVILVPPSYDYIQKAPNVRLTRALGALLYCNVIISRELARWSQRQLGQSLVSGWQCPNGRSHKK